MLFKQKPFLDSQKLTQFEQRLQALNSNNNTTGCSDKVVVSGALPLMNNSLIGQVLLITPLTTPHTSTTFGARNNAEVEFDISDKQNVSKHIFLDSQKPNQIGRLLWTQNNNKNTTSCCGKGVVSGEASLINNPFIGQAHLIAPLTTQPASKPIETRSKVRSEANSSDKQNVAKQKLTPVCEERGE